MAENLKDNSFSHKAVGFLTTLIILCCVIRLLAFGYLLYLYYWIIIPLYVLHCWGQFNTLYKRLTLYSIDRTLVLISTILLVILTLIQADFADSGGLYLIDIIICLLGGKAFLPVPSESLVSFIPVIVLWIADATINIWLLWRRHKLE